MPTREIASSPAPSPPSAIPDGPSPRLRGWTTARKIAFLERLALRGNVRLACRQVGISAEAAYRLRRRDALFARAWNAALVLAQDAGEQELADRATDGIAEEVWYRGEVVGIRRRFDARLFLAHLARLDRQVAAAGGHEDAGYFDELLAMIARQPDREDIAGGAPPSRDGAPDPSGGPAAAIDIHPRTVSTVSTGTRDAPPVAAPADIHPRTVSTVSTCPPAKPVRGSDPPPVPPGPRRR